MIFFSETQKFINGLYNEFKNNFLSHLAGIYLALFKKVKKIGIRHFVFMGMKHKEAKIFENHLNHVK